MHQRVKQSGQRNQTRKTAAAENVIWLELFPELMPSPPSPPASSSQRPRLVTDACSIDKMSVWREAVPFSGAYRSGGVTASQQSDPNHLARLIT